jgi:hypothetical protein
MWEGISTTVLKDSVMLSNHPNHFHSFFFFPREEAFHLLVMLGIKPRALRKLGKHSIA